jgi:hypothetical protein
METSKLTAIVFLPMICNVIRLSFKAVSIRNSIKASEAKSSASYVTFGWDNNLSDVPTLLESFEHRFCTETIWKIREKVCGDIIRDLSV